MVAPGESSDSRVKRMHSPLDHKESLKSLSLTCRLGVDLPPRLFDGFDRRFFGLGDVDGAGGGLVEEVLRVLPQRAVLDGHNLRGRAGCVSGGAREYGGSGGDET